jgi:hypothetical protein
MRRLGMAALLVLATILSLGPAGPRPATAHPAGQSADPPDLGTVVLTDPLTAPGLVTPAWCPTSAGFRHLTDEGLVLRAHGPCASSPTAPTGLSADFRQLLLRDGEIRLEARSLSAGDRLSLRLAFRTQAPTDLTMGYRIHLDAPDDVLTLVRQTEGGSATILNQRANVGSRLRSGEWTSLAVRMRGPTFWVYVDDTMVLTADDATFAEGGGGISVVRLDDSSEEEVAIAVRNVQITALANGGAARASTLTAPPVPPDAPEPGGVILQDPLTDSQVVPVLTCPPDRQSGPPDPEGLAVRIEGKCRPDAQDASIQLPIRGPVVGDGEVALDLRVAEGNPRAEIALYVRMAGQSVLGCTFNPATGSASLFKIADRQTTLLAYRLDLHRYMDATAWNRVAIVAAGREAWVLVNDQPLMYSDNAALDPGSAAVKIAREGAPDDEQELAVVLRNLTISALASGNAPR